MDIKERIKNTREKMLARRKSHYAYAKSKGFSSYECTVLAGHSKENIDKFANEDNECGKDA